MLCGWDAHILLPLGTCFPAKHHTETIINERVVSCVHNVAVVYIYGGRQYMLPPTLLRISSGNVCALRSLQYFGSIITNHIQYSNPKLVSLRLISWHLSPDSRHRLFGWDSSIIIYACLRYIYTIQ